MSHSSQPPPIPQRTRRPTKKQSQSSRHSVAVCTAESNKWNLSGAVTLPQFVEQFSDQLPLSIQVQTGYLGESGRVTLSAFDRLNIHFVKHTEVVKANVSSVQFSIPTNSALEFSLLYNPNGKVDEALKGMTFKTIANLIREKIPPKVVFSMKAWKNDMCSISEGEVLVMKGINSPQKVTNMRETVTVYSVSFSIQKILPLECEGEFTTNPKCLHLYLPEYIKHVSNLFPCEVCIQTRKSDVRDRFQTMPQRFVASVITLTATCIETTLIASSALSEFSDEIMEIPIDIPEVNIAVIQSVDLQQVQELYANACHVLKHYDPNKVLCMKDASTEEDYTIQTQLYTCVREGFETDGIQSIKDYDYIHVFSPSGKHQSIEKPIETSTPKRPLPPLPSQKTLPSLQSPITRNDGDATKPLQVINNKMVDESQFNDPPSSFSQMKQDEVQKSDLMMESTLVLNESQQDTKALITRIEQLQNSVQVLQSKVQAMERIELQIKQHDLMLKKLQVAIGINEPEDESTIAERNRQYVSKLTTREVSISGVTLLLKHNDVYIINSYQLLTSQQR